MKRHSDTAEQLVEMHQALGFSRSIARVLVYLIVCEPASQTAKEIQAALHLSTGATNEALRVLVGMGTITRAKSGRQYIYRLDSDTWERSFSRQLALIDALTDTAKSARKLLPDNDRLPRLIDLYEYVSKESKKMLANYQAKN